MADRPKKEEKNGNVRKALSVRTTLQHYGIYELPGSKENESFVRLLPIVDAVAVVIMRNDKILSIFNEKWGAFALPMTKVRSRENLESEKSSRLAEDGAHAALRAAAEVLGTTLTIKPEVAGDFRDYIQSESDGQYKRYRIQVFTIKLPADFEDEGSHIINWYTPSELLDPNREPVSITTRNIVGDLFARNKRDS